jgi:hypothetical protein
MKALFINMIITFINLMFFIPISAQNIDFKGQAAGWVTVNKTDEVGFQTGFRYLPQLLMDIPLKNNFKFDGEFSADGFMNYTYLPDTGSIFSSKARLYRFWVRFSGDRFEIRAGLQKINFGSALMLRPLMWFDRIDPRDPLKLTTGVYSLLGKYYFKNNANIWLWVLYGNKNTKGWELVPSNPKRPEIGGRLQFPVPRGEIAFTYHNRVGEFPDDWQPAVSGSHLFPEDRFGLDFKLDLGVGIWYEGTLVHQKQNEISPYTRSMTIGADYTFGIGDGLNITAEHLWYEKSDKPFSGGTGLSFTGVSAGIPVSVISRISAILFYDWKNKGWYRFANLAFTWDNLAINIIGFWNPQSFQIFNYESGPNLFSGGGGQVMVVYNH